MKRVFLLILLLLPFVGIAQEETVEELRRDFDGIVDFFLPAVIGQLAVLFADAKKYMGSGMWDFNIFWKTKILPFIIVVVGAVIVYLILIYAPFAKPLLEVFIGPLGEVTALLLFGGVQSLVDNLMKPTVDPVNQLAVNHKYNPGASKQV